MNIERWTLRDSLPSGGSVSLSDAISGTFGECECGYDSDLERIAASFVKIDLESLTLVRYFGRGTHWAERRQEHIRRRSSDDFLFYLPHNNKVTIHQGGVTSSLAAGQIGFVNTRNTYRGQLEGVDGESFESTHLIVPGPLLRSRFPGIDDLAGHGVDIGESLHDIVSAYVRTLGSKDYLVDGPRRKALAGIMFETLCSISGYALETRPVVSPVGAPSVRGLERIQGFILANLADPKLSVPMIARRLNMSPRYVHAAFEGAEWTAKAWIKHRRLLECRKAIRCPDLKHRTLTEIAFSWGFSDFSHFSRCYKAKFGCSPKEDRPR